MMPGGSFKYPIPNNDTDWETVCCRVMARELGVQSLQKFKRRGQSQYGIDLIGADRDGKTVVVQCKSRTTDTDLPENEAQADVDAAKGLIDDTTGQPVRVDHFVIASTYRHNNHTAWARNVSVDHAATNLFSVRVYAWCDIETILNNHKDLREEYLGLCRKCAPPNTVPALSRTFIAREALTAKIHDALNAPGPAGIVRQAAARAFGGYGKTVAALLYAHEYRSHYPAGTFFLSMGLGQLVDALARLCEHLGLPTDLTPPQAAAAVKHALETATNPDGTPAASLLIIDNIDTVERWTELSSERIADDTRPLLPRGNCRVLVTTRVQGLPQTREIAIGRLTNDEAREVYARFCNDADTSAIDGRDAPDEKTADTITQLLGGLAVAVAAVAARMKLSPHTPWSAYAANLANITLDQLPDVSEEVRNEIGTDATALAEHRRTLHVIDDAIRALSPPARRAVEYAVLLPQDMVPRPWLEWLLDHDAAQPATNADGTPNPLALAMPTPADVPGSPAPGFVSLLLRLDVLIQVGEEGKILSLHRLWERRITELANGVQAAPSPLLISLSRCAALREADLVRGDRGRGHGSMSDPIVVVEPHAQWEVWPLVWVCARLQQARMIGVAARIGVWLAPILQDLGYPKIAVSVLDLSPQTHDEVLEWLGPDALCTAYVNLCCAHQGARNFHAALFNIDVALKLAGQLYWPSHEAFVSCYFERGNVLARMGEPNKALNCYQDAMSVFQKLPDKSDELHAKLLSNLSLVLVELDKVPAARAAAKEAVEIKERYRLQNPVSLARSYANFAKVCQADNDQPTACEYLAKALALFEEHLRPMHPYIEIMRSNIKNAGCHPSADERGVGNN